MNRRGYLDWLRGVAVLIMVEAHALDAWTRLSDRGGAAYTAAMFVGGLGAPFFLFLAGVALALAAASRLERGYTEAAVAQLARRRAWQIFGLAFLFRFQAWVVSGGQPLYTLFKVDILNIMALSMLVAALLWRAGRDRASRLRLLALVTVAIAMLAPILQSIPLHVSLPPPMEWYLRPYPNRGAFSLFPWTAFLLAGTAVGVWLASVGQGEEERRLVKTLGLVGFGVATMGLAADLLLPTYAEAVRANSPTFFFFRLGVVMAALPLAYAWNQRRPGPLCGSLREFWTRCASQRGPWRAKGAEEMLAASQAFRGDIKGRGSLAGWSPLRELGLSSLFVYWIHVEMAYGTPSAALHKRFSLAEAVAAYLAFSVLLYGLVRLKNRAAAMPVPEFVRGLVRRGRRQTVEPS